MALRLKLRGAFGNGVEALSAPRMTATDPSQGKRRAAPGPVAPNGLRRIV